MFIRTRLGLVALFVSLAFCFFNWGPILNDVSARATVVPPRAVHAAAGAGARIVAREPERIDLAHIYHSLLGTPSGRFSFSLTAPSVSGLDPSSATAGGPPFTLSVNGSDFAEGFVVNINGSARPTTFESADRLTTSVEASDIATAGTFQVTVFDPDPVSGGESSPLTFTINNPAPSLDSISPDHKTAGDDGFTLTVSGSNFVDGAVVNFNGDNRSTNFISSTEVTASIPASDIAAAGTYNVTVTNPAPGGGESGALDFTINPQPNPAPALATLSQTSATVGAAPFVLTVNGSDFVGGSVVRFDGKDRVTTFVSETELSAQLVAADLQTAGVFPVNVFNPAPGGGLSGALDFTVNNPAPSVSAISPSAKTAGDAAFTLTVSGSDFVPTSTVRWNGADRTTHFASATELTADISAADISATGTYQVTVFNPAPGGGASAPASFAVNNPLPAVGSLAPASALVGGADFTLTVNGSGFNTASVVRWNGSDRATAFVSATQLTAEVLATDLETTGGKAVTVFNPAPGGGESAPLTFTVNNPAPTASALAPTNAVAGSGALTLTVTGTNFNAASVVRWAGSDRVTSYVSATQLTAAVTTADVAAAGTYPVTVFNPAPGGGESAPLTFAVNNPVPTLAAISPVEVMVGSPDFTLTATGTGFNANSVVQFNGAVCATTYVSPTQLTAVVQTAAVFAPGVYPVTVTNPAPGGGTSAPSDLTVNNPVPTVSSVSPETKTAGDAAFSLTVTGTNFNGTSVVYFNGLPRVSTTVSPTQMTAEIPATDLVAGGIFPVTVVNPPPGGGTSAPPVNLTVTSLGPSITSLSVAGGAGTVGAGEPDFVLTVNGLNFNPVSKVSINGVERATVFVSPTQLTATILAADITMAGAYPVTVANPPPGGGTSAAVNLTVTPTVTALAPASFRAGDPGGALSLTGAGFPVGSVVRFNGGARSTTYVSATQLSASLTAADVAAVGLYPVTVITPAPPGLVSNAVNLQVIPSVTNLTPLAREAGTGAFTLTVNGVGFVSGSAVRWNGSSRTTTFVNSTRLTAAITAADVAAMGTASVTVQNPTNLLVSNAITFAITSTPPATECAASADVTAANPGLLAGGQSRSQMWRTEDGVWWGAFSDNTNGIYFYKRVNQTTWAKGALIDTNLVSGVYVAGAPDALWNGTNLFVLVQESTTLAKLYKYTYNTTAQTYAVVTGFPVSLPLNGVGTDDDGDVNYTVAIEQDSTGKLWAAYSATGILSAAELHVIWSTSADHRTWNNTGAVLATGLSTLQAESVAIAKFGGNRVAVAWGDSVANEYGFRYHTDGQAEATWSAREVIDSGLGPEGTGPVVSTSMSMRGLADGRLFIVANDRDGANKHLNLYGRSAAGVWGPRTLVVNDFNRAPRKPVLLLDTENSIIHVIFKDSAVGANGLMGQTFITQASMANPAFNTPCLFMDTSESTLSTSNPTSTKQPLTATTDLVAAASTGRAGNHILTNTVDLTPNVLTVFNISPKEVTAGETGNLSLAVNGKLFNTSSRVRLGGVNKTTAFVNAGRLTGTIPATDTATAGNKAITVRNTTPSTVDSNTVNLVVTAQHPTPVVTVVFPNRERVGGAQFTLTVHGSAFRRASVVRFNGASRTTTFVSDTELRATIPASDLLVAGVYPVTVFNPTPGGGSSAVVKNSKFYVQPSCASTTAQTIAGATRWNTVKSQMWFNDSMWWAAFSDDSTGIYFYKRAAGTSGAWTKGALLASNLNGRPDVLWNGTHLFVLVYDSNTSARLFKFTYNTATDTYAAATGFPVTLPLTGIGTGTSDSQYGAVTLAQDSTGKLWASYPGTGPGGDSNYRVIWSTSADHRTWNTAGYVLDTGGSTVTQEVMPVVHFGGDRIGVMWSKQPTKEIAFRYHLDGQPETTWSAREVIDSGNGDMGLGGVADNHMSVKAAPDGRLFLVAKDSDEAGYLHVYVRAAAGGWSPRALVNPDPQAMATRPTLMLDLENSDLYVLYADSYEVEALAYLSRTSMNAVSFGPPCPFVSTSISDVTSTKQNMNAATGLMAAGSTGSIPDQIYTRLVALAAGSGNTPVVSSLSPSGIPFSPGGPFTLTVNGSNFNSGSVVYFNGMDRATTFVSPTQLVARINATDIPALGNYPVTVMNPKGGYSATVNFGVTSGITSLTPSSATAGSSAFTLTVTGTNFASGSVVHWNGAPRTTTYLSATQLTATVTAADVAAAGTAGVTVITSGTTSAPAVFTVNNPVPVVTSLSPASVLTGSDALTLTVNGSGFNANSVVQWNGQPRPTSLVSLTQLTAQLTAADLAAAANASVTVTNPSPGGGTSGAQTFAVNNPAPAIDPGGLSPATRLAGEAGFTLTVNGSGFNANSVVRWNGADRATTYVGPTQLSAAVTAADVAAAGTRPVNVFNPAPGGGTSGTVNFVVSNPCPPTLSSISPTGVVEGNADFALTVTGTNFNSNSVVQLGGADRPTTYVSGTQLTAQLTAADVATAGAYSITVFNPAPGGCGSNAATLTVTPNVRRVRVADITGASNSNVPVFVELTAQGDERALAFSLTFDTTLLNSPTAALAGGAYGATLTVNGTQAAQGRLGLSVTLPSGQTFAAGTRQVVVVTFMTAAVGGVTATTVGFGDQPVQRQATSAGGGALPTGYGPGTVTLRPGVEADTAPRPNGNGSVSVTDWTQVGRFATGLDTAGPGFEFQKADCAPRSSLGNGSITISDWVQAGRYVSGLDVIPEAGGPSLPATVTAAPATSDAAKLSQAAVMPSNEEARSVRLVGATTPDGQPAEVFVELDARGGENAVGFSLVFDPSKLSFVSAANGADAEGAVLNLNTDSLASGRLGVAQALATGLTYPAGTRRLMVLTFRTAIGANGRARLSFTDAPVAREVVDGNAQAVRATYSDGEVVINAAEDPADGNPADDPDFFVGQHYRDFLNREPDAEGLRFWVDNINSCGADLRCREVKRINVSAAFFLSIEFQETGYFVYRLYQAAYGDAYDGSGPVPAVRFDEFVADAREVGRGVRVGAGDWRRRLDDNRRDFALAFVSRPRFAESYPNALTPAEFLARLDRNAGGVLTAEEAEALAREMVGAGDTRQARALALSKVAENAELARRETARAFVLMQYFGYLRRDPAAPPDSDYSGYRYWLDKLNRRGGDYVGAELVRAFITSAEYRRRFAPR